MAGGARIGSVHSEGHLLPAEGSRGEGKLPRTPTPALFQRGTKHPRVIPRKLRTAWVRGQLEKQKISSMEGDIHKSQNKLTGGSIL